MKRARRPQRRAGRCQLAIWIPAALGADVRSAAAAAGKSQREIVEAALKAYLAAPLPGPAPT